MFIAHIAILVLLLVLALLFVVALTEAEVGHAVFLAMIALAVYGVGWSIGVLPPLTVWARTLG